MNKVGENNDHRAASDFNLRTSGLVLYEGVQSIPLPLFLVVLFPACCILGPQVCKAGGILQQPTTIMFPCPAYCVTRDVSFRKNQNAAAWFFVGVPSKCFLLLRISHYLIPRNNTGHALKLGKRLFLSHQVDVLFECGPDTFVCRRIFCVCRIL